MPFDSSSSAPSMSLFRYQISDCRYSDRMNCDSPSFNINPADIIASLTVEIGQRCLALNSGVFGLRISGSLRASTLCCEEFDANERVLK